MTAATHPSSSLPHRPQWNLSFTHDALGRMTSQSDPLGTVSYSYDEAGRRTGMTYPGGGLTLGYFYTITGELTHIRENPSGSNFLLASFDYDDRGRRTLLTRGNGTTTSYGYDAVSRLSQIVQDLNGTSNDLTLDFTHNPAGQIATGTRSNDAYSFVQANADVTDTVNGLNQLTATGGASVSHDARGNVTAIGSRTFAYASDNSLVLAPADDKTFGYDPLGRLLYVYPTAANGDWLQYDGHSLIVDYGAGPVIRRRYVHGPGHSTGTGRDELSSRPPQHKPPREMGLDRALQAGGDLAAALGRARLV